MLIPDTVYVLFCARKPGILYCMYIPFQPRQAEFISGDFRFVFGTVKVKDMVTCLQTSILSYPYGEVSLSYSLNELHNSCSASNPEPDYFEEYMYFVAKLNSCFH